MAQIELKNIVKTYDKKKTIINNVSLTVIDKEFLVLAGPSGCGKSTLLRIIAGLEEASSGEIYIGGRCVNNVPPKDRDIAFVFQNYALYPHMSVYENMAFPLKMRRMKKNEIDAKVKETAEILNLTEYLNKKPRELSGGQRQRTALGRAIVRNPQVFLMDEPLSNLDAKLRVQMRAEIKKLHQKLNASFVYVTHDQTEAMTMGDRIAVINEGVIQQIGEPLEIYKNPVNMFTAGFLGSPPMNFIPAAVNENSININGSILKLNNSQKEKLNGRKEAVLGIRPENFDDINSNFQFKAETDIIELLGNMQAVYFKISDKICCALLNADIKIQKEHIFKFNTDSILFFDKNSGLRL